MSNLQKSSSRFSSRRFTVAIALLIVSTGAAYAENRNSATSVNAPASALAELVQDAMRIFWLLAGGEECKAPAPSNFGPPNQTEGEIDTEIEVEPPPTYP